MSDKKDQDSDDPFFTAVPVEEDPFFAPPEVLAEVAPPPPLPPPPPPPVTAAASESMPGGDATADAPKPSAAEVMAQRRRREEERRQREAEEAEARRVLEEACPWENAHEMGFLASWWQSVLAILTRPVAFFSHIPEQTGIGRALLFGLLTATFAHVMSLPRRFLEFQSAEPVRRMIEEWMQRMHLGEIAQGMIQQSENFWFTEMLGLAGFPVGWLAGTFLVSLLTHVPVRLFGGQGGLGATFRSLAYATPVTLLGMIPWLGGPLMVAGHLVLIPTGLQIQHRLSTPRLIMAMLFWPLLGLLSILLLGAIFMTALSGLMPE